MENNIIQKRVSFLNKLSFLLTMLGLFFIPFNSYEGIPFFGEFSRESSIIFFLLVIIINIYQLLITQKLKIPLKHPLFQLLILALFWFFLTFILNGFDISSYYFKNTSGIERFFRQYIALLISSVFLLLSYYRTFSTFDIKSVFLKIRKVFLFSFIVVSIYTFIEALIIYLGQTQLIPVLYLFDYFPFCEAFLDTKFGRLSSVTYEPPAFAAYLMTIAGWMFSYILTSKKYYAFIPSILVVLFAFLSGSRSGLFIILVQLFVFILFFIKRKRYHSSLIKIFLAILIISIPIILLKGKPFAEYVVQKITSFELDNSDHSNSNQSRFGMIYTSGLVFIQNPIKGVGFGQVAFEAKDQYPNWATKNNWEFRDRYLNENYKPFPPSYNIYTRLLAETGIIGFSLFSILVISLIYVCYKNMIIQKESSWMHIILLISFCGFLINWVQIDTFRIFGFWICLALFYILTKGKVKINYRKLLNE